MTDLQKKLFSAFDSEYRTILETIRAFVGVVESTREAPTTAALSEAFRMAHTLKGSAQIVGFSTIVTVAHRLESLFAKIRDGVVVLEMPVIRLIHASVDLIEDIVAASRNESSPPDVQNVVVQIEDVLNKTSSNMPSLKLPVVEALTSKASHAPSISLVAVAAADNEMPPIAAPLMPVSLTPPPASTITPAQTPTQTLLPMSLSLTLTPTPAPTPTPTPQVLENETVRLKASHLDQLLRTTGELLSVIGGSREVDARIAVVGSHLNSILREWELVRRISAGALQKMNRTPEFARIAQFLDLVGSELLPISKKVHAAREASKLNEWSLRHLTEQLQNDVRKARTVAAETVFGGFNKMVRDLATELKRPIDFRLTGLDVEADRVVLQALKDPLMHILRNSVDHGIESQEVRASRGKDLTAKILVRIAAVGGRLNITIEDDGQGLNEEKIREQAVDHSLVSAAEASLLSSQELSQLIFRPGFSTAKEISNLSGRGLGMSIVSEAVHRLQGQIRIESVSGEKLVISVSVPISLANHRLVLISHDDQTYAIPSGNVGSLKRVKKSALMTVEGQLTFRFEGQQVPVVSLGTLIGSASAGVALSNEVISLVVLHFDGSDGINGINGITGKKLAVAVDFIYDECEAIIKNLGAPFAKRKIFAGAILQGDGQLALVLDPNVIIEQFSSGTRDSFVQPATSIAKPKNIKTPLRILVVDDSITTRTLEKGILESNGHHVSLAVDGLDALSRLQVENFDLVISDVEMPRMDGFTLVGEIKRHPKFSKIPVIMVTSLENIEDQQRGLSLGANAYVLKQKFDQGALLETIRRVVA